MHTEGEIQRLGMPHQFVEIFMAKTVLQGHETTAVVVFGLIIVVLVCSHLIPVVIANLLGNSRVNADQLEERRSPPCSTVE